LSRKRRDRAHITDSDDDDHHNWEVVNAESGDEEPYSSDQTEATSDGDDSEVFRISIGSGGGGPDEDYDTGPVTRRW